MNICVIGLGYVGYPLFEAFSKNYETYGIDLEEKVKKFNNEKITTDYSVINNCDVVFVCAPTPVDDNNKPDISGLINISKNISGHLKDGHIIVYESTVGPRDINKINEILNKDSPLSYFNNERYYVVYSPERVSPGETTLKDCKKLVACPNEKIRNDVCQLYESIGVKTYPCSDYKIAILSKLLENIQRDVNIALMNEYANICQTNFDVNFDEVLKAASTKHNFVPYNRGLVGGHCIPVDPYYLLDSCPSGCRELMFINHSRIVNDFTIECVADKIYNIFRKYKHWCILGAAYKENIDDTRNSGSLKLYNQLMKKLSYEQYITVHDPYIKQYSYFPENADCYILATPHDWYNKFDFLKERPLYDVRGAWYNSCKGNSNYYGFGMVNNHQ